MGLPISNGIYRITLPLPLWSKDVNVYLIEDRDGFVLLDCGANTNEAFAALRSRLKELGVSLGEVSRILITHCHHDHYGLVGRIRRVSPATAAMHAAESEQADRIYVRGGRESPGLRRLLLAYGLPDRYAEKAEEMMLAWRGLVSPAAIEDQLTDGQMVNVGSNTFRVLHTPGHSAGHVCFYDPGHRLLLAGDHLSAEKIPHVGVTLFTGGNPLRQYLDSLRQVSALDIDMVLPGHGAPFADHRRRIEDVIAYYSGRTDQVLRALEGGRRTAYEVSLQAFGGDPSTFGGRLAFTETLAHLELLASEGRIERYQDGGTTLFRSGSA
jgi:glyoxylase-like metal-dependent hydrolase (beta-lactamase superfamily II)